MGVVWAGSVASRTYRDYWWKGRLLSGCGLGGVCSVQDVQRLLVERYISPYGSKG